MHLFFVKCNERNALLGHVLSELSVLFDIVWMFIHLFMAQTGLAVIDI